MKHLQSATIIPIKSKETRDIRHNNPCAKPPKIFLSGIKPWVNAKSKHCLVCGDRPLRDDEYCLGCDRSGEDVVYTKKYFQENPKIYRNAG